MSRRP